MKTMMQFLKVAQRCGFTSLTQVRVFLALADVDGESSAKPIADATGLEPSQVSTVFRTLSDWRFLDLSKGRELIDGRQAVRVYVRMSTRGRQVLEMLTTEVAP